MYFCNTELVSVDRKSPTENSQELVRIEGYDAVFSLNRSKSMDAMFTQFYKLLKVNNRIINSSFAFFNQDLEVIRNRLIEDTGIKPNRLIYSDLQCYEKVWNGREPSRFYEHKILVNAESSNEFVVCSYSAVCTIGTLIEYNVKRDEWVFKEPDYIDKKYKKSHYNYYYGIKFS
jgi:hypothetical protein